jgi:hypothetical protein
MRAFVKVRDGEGAVASVRGARAPHFDRRHLIAVWWHSTV